VGNHTGNWSRETEKKEAKNKKRNREGDSLKEETRDATRGPYRLVFWGPIITSPKRRKRDQKQEGGGNNTHEERKGIRKLPSTCQDVKTHKQGLGG